MWSFWPTWEECWCLAHLYPYLVMDPDELDLNIWSSLLTLAIPSAL